MPASPESQLRWSYVSTFSTAGMQLLAAATITRFLQPRDYGLAAMAMLCSSLAGYFTQLGMARAVIQKPSLSLGNIRAAFTLSLATGVGGALVLGALSPLLARYFREPRLPPILLVFSLNLIFQSLAMVSGGLLRREFRMRDLAICDFVGYLFSTFGLGLPLAIKGYGVWALVASNVSQPFLTAVAYFVARPHSIVPTLQRQDYAHITAFGGKASVTTAVEAVGASLDTILLGRLVTPSSLGIYNRSLTLSTIPIYNLAQGLARVFYPALARAAGTSLEECRRMLEASETQLLAVILPTCMGAAIAAPTIIPVIFGKQWSAAIPLYQVLCAMAAFDVTPALPCIQLEVLALFRRKFIIQTAFALALGVIVLLTARFGIVTVAVSLAGLQFVRSLALHRVSAQSLGTSPWSLLRTWLPGTWCSLVIGAALYALQAALLGRHRPDAALRLVLLVLAAIVVAVPFYWAFYRESVYTPWTRLFRRAQL